MEVDILFLGIGLLGTFFIHWNRQHLKRYSFLAVAGCYLILLGMAHLTILSLLNGTYLFLFPLVWLSLFYGSWKKEKRSVLNGFLCLLFIGSYLLLGLYLNFLANSFLLSFLTAIGLFILMLLLLFGFLGLVVFLFWNARIVFKRERAILMNMLTLLGGIGLLIFEGLRWVLGMEGLPLFLQGLIGSSTYVLGYYYFLFAIYLASTLLFNLNRPAYNKKYIIVLGAWLFQGKKVTPLLHARILRAIQFAYSQQAATGILPKLIMSGGKGSDEHVSEAFAMYEAALELGFPEAFILREEESTTTYENLLFSKALMKADGGDEFAPALISTNNYHLFRAGIYARKAKLNAEGIGAKTAKYYLPNGFLREFIAFIAMKKWLHLGVSLALVILSVINVYVIYFFAQ